MSIKSIAKIVLASAMLSCAQAQTYAISTVAGGALPVNIPGTSAFLRDVTAVAVDGSGNVFFPSQNVVLRLDAITGLLSVVAGNGTEGFSGDNGLATSAQLRYPRGVAVDSDGNLYIADYYDMRVRKVSGGVITTVAGNGQRGLSGDNGPATSARLDYPFGVAVDTVGNLYIANSGGGRVRKVSGGVITTVAGNGTFGFSGDKGPATSAQLNNPTGIAVDSAGNLYIGDWGNHRVRLVSGGVITTVAGNGTQGGISGDNGAATSAQLRLPAGVAVDSSDNLYIAEWGNSRIRNVSDGVITTVASTQFGAPFGVAMDLTGNLYITDGNSRIRKVWGGAITTAAGGGVSLGDNGPATSAQVDPDGVALDSVGNLYIADTEDNLIRKVSGGVITTVAGNGERGFSGDNGPANRARLNQPSGVAVDSVGNLYIADLGGNLIRKVSGGVITTVAGGGSSLGDNVPATSARLGPFGDIAVDSGGNLYIADAVGHRIRKVSDGVITTVAGNGTRGFSGDNGAATSAQLSSPGGIAVDSVGNLYIADSNNYRIRKVSDGVITTVAGNGSPGFSGDNGAATSARLNQPGGIAVDTAGNLYLADSTNYRVRKVSDGVITTVAGGGSTFGDDGPATSAQLSRPIRVVVDSAGNVYVADRGNHRVRLLQPQPAATPSIDPF